LFAEQVRELREVRWDAQAERVEAREVMAWEQLVLHENVGAEPTPLEAEHVLVEAAQAAGSRAFAPEGALDRWTARVRFAATLDPSIRAPDDQDVQKALSRLCEGRRSFSELREAGLLRWLRSDLGDRAGDIDRLAPERVTLAGGRSVLVRYESGKPPSIASRLQDFFGMRDGPRLGHRVPLVLELLAPNGRAVQVTADLAGFWLREYPAIRRALMRRYPKHAWPENPCG
jgi:ATP-dependent helicase HrpB